MLGGWGWWRIGEGGDESHGGRGEGGVSGGEGGGGGVREGGGGGVGGGGGWRWWVSVWVGVVMMMWECVFRMSAEG